MEVDQSLIASWVGDRGSPVIARDLRTSIGPIVGIGPVVHGALQSRSAAIRANDSVAASRIRVCDAATCRERDGSNAAGNMMRRMRVAGRSFVGNQVARIRIAAPPRIISSPASLIPVAYERS